MDVLARRSAGQAGEGLDVGAIFGGDGRVVARLGLVSDERATAHDSRAHAEQFGAQLTQMTLLKRTATLADVRNVAA